MRHIVKVLFILAGVTNLLPLGTLIIVAAFRSHLRVAATIAGLTSMLAFITLAVPLDRHGAALQAVVWADAIAVLLLTAGFLLSRRESPAAPR